MTKEPIFKYSTKCGNLDLLGGGNLVKLIEGLQAAVRGTPELYRDSVRCQIGTEDEWLSIEIWYEVEE